MKEKMVDNWLERLLDAIEKDGRSARKISLAADLGPNFVTQMLKDGKVPGVKQAIKLADALGLSLGYLFIGDDVSQEEERFFQLFRTSTPEGQKLAFQILESLRQEE
jgi:transcriptional regulator with XRE-family HTH domain